MANEDWVALGAADNLAQRELQPLTARHTPIALCHRDGRFTALSGVCNHVGGPLGEGIIEGEYVTCPWNFWKFHWQTGKTRPEIGDGSVPTYRVKVEQGTVYVDLASASERKKIPHAPHPLARPIRREPGPVRVVGVSTTMMNVEHPRPSTSELLL
jgi:nitrite reductase/ring-hydroxylating ferredoxin subunit